MFRSQLAFSTSLQSRKKSSGESRDCHSFISQCELHFEFNASAFSLDCAKISFIISYLTGRDRTWANAEWSLRSAVCYSLPEFLKAFIQIFQSTTPGREEPKALVSLK